MVKKIEKVKKKVGCPKKYTPEYIESIAKDLEKWARKEDSLFMQTFMGEHKDYLEDDHFHEWKKESPKFAETLAKVKKILIGRLHTKACFKVLDGGYVAKIMPLICLEYRKWRQQESKIAEEGKNQRIEVVVKERKSDAE